MKHRLLKIIKSNVHLLLTAVALLCVSQGAWGYDLYIYANNIPMSVYAFGNCGKFLGEWAGSSIQESTKFDAIGDDWYHYNSTLDNTYAIIFSGNGKTQSNNIDGLTDAVLVSYISNNKWESYTYKAVDIRGTFNSWGSSDVCSFDPDEKIFSVEIGLSSGEHEFKVVKNGSDWLNAIDSDKSDITLSVDGNIKFSLASAQTIKFCFEPIGGKAYLKTVSTPCTDPSPSFEISAQLNKDEGSPWAGTSGTGTGDNKASGGVFADSYRTATLTTSTSATYYEWYGCNSDGSSPTTTPTNVTFNSRTSQTCTAQFNLPGTYYFVCYAGCSSASVASSVVQVDVPYPEMGVSGPFYDGYWNHTKAGESGPKFTRDGLTWTNTFNCNTATGRFIIIQQYKLGCTENSGWDGYEECTGKSDGNKINKATISSHSGINVLDNENKNFSADISGLQNGDEVTITVTMTAYNTYSITMTGCSKPTVSITAGPSAVCAGATSIVFTAVGATSDGTISSYTWNEPSNWTKTAQDDSNGTATYTIRAAGTVSVTATNSCEKTSDADTKAVTIKTAPSTPEISGNAIMCGPSSAGEYTYTATSGADYYVWGISGNGSIYSDTQTNSITVTAGDVNNGSVTLTVVARNCPSLQTPLDSPQGTKSITVYKSAAAGTVTLSTESACAGDQLTATASGTWYTGGGSLEWSSSNSDYATISSSSASSATVTAKAPTSSVNIICTITEPTCDSNNKSAYSSLTVNGVAAFSISGSSSATPWAPVTLSTSNSQSAAWSITSPSPAGTAYLTTQSGASTKLKAPDNNSGSGTTYTVSATITEDGCSKSSTKNVTVTAPECN